jgi:protein TonB
MASFGSHPLVTRPELVRWGLCATVVVAAHGLVALALATRSGEADVAAGAPVVMIEVAPQPEAPAAPPRDLAPGPALETQSQDRVGEAAPPEPEKTEKKEEKEKVVEAPTTPDPALVVPKPEPMAEEGPIDDKTPPPALAAPLPTAPPSAPRVAALPAAPAVGQVARPTRAAITRWERLLVAQLERHKRYPPQAHGKAGEARLAFSIDRAGHVVASRIVRSSGSEALDAETLAMLKRAAPLPPPPAGVSDESLSFVVPISYR